MSLRLKPSHLFLAVSNEPAENSPRSSSAPGRNSERSSPNFSKARAKIGQRTKRSLRRKRKELQLRAVVLKKIVPLLVLRGPAARPALVVEYLLHPKASQRRIQQRQQREVILFRRVCGKLDHRRRLLEDLSAAVQNKVIVGRDVGVGDGEGGAEATRARNRLRTRTTAARSPGRSSRPDSLAGRREVRTARPQEAPEYRRIRASGARADMASSYGKQNGVVADVDSPIPDADRRRRLRDDVDVGSTPARFAARVSAREQ